MQTLILVCASLFLGSGQIAQGPARSVSVPDSEAAIKIAEATLIPVYGKNKVISERPFHASLNDEVWTVTGTLHCKDNKATCKGGVAIVRLSRAEGRVISMSHGK
jgi:hypothetical protein